MEIIKGCSKEEKETLLTMYPVLAKNAEHIFLHDSDNIRIKK